MVVSQFDIYLYGVASPFTAEVLAVARRAGFNVVACIDNVDEARHMGWPGHVESARIHDLSRDIPVLLPLGTERGSTRDRAGRAAKSQGFRLATALVDPSAVVLGAFPLGLAAYVGPGAVIGANSQIRDGALVNRSASIGHDCYLAGWSNIGPAAVLAGSVTVGEFAFVGAGAVVLPGRTIGAGATVGAGSVVTRDVEPGMTVVGNPAQVIQSRTSKKV